MIRAVQFRLALVATVLLLQISFHTAHARVSTLVGDVDGNGEVETTDLDMVISCFGQTAPLLPPCDDADVAPPPDGDGMVNLLDILLVGSNFIPTGGRLCVVKGRADETWNLEARMPAPVRRIPPAVPDRSWSYRALSPRGPPIAICRLHSFPRPASRPVFLIGTRRPWDPPGSPQPRGSDRLRRITPSDRGR